MMIATEALDDIAITWLARLSSGEVSPAVEHEFFAWLQASPEHQAAYLRAESLWQRGAALAQLKPARPMPMPQRLRPRLSWGLGLAAAIVLAVPAYLSFERGTQEHYSLTTQYGEQKSLQLTDGSRVTLNSHASVDIDYSRHGRHVRLTQGEVFFDVAPNPDRPFDVITQAGAVRVLGTHFAVRQTANDALVTVLEGRVALAASIEDLVAQHPAVVLTNSQELSLKNAAAGGAPQVVNTKTALAWRNKQLIYQNEPLAKLVGDLVNFYGVPIELPPELADRPITAVIQLGSLEQTLRTLAPLDLAAQFDAPQGPIRLQAKAQNANH